MNRKKMSKKEWAKHCAENSQNSWCIIVCLAIMHLWEKGVQNREEATKELSLYHYSLSDIQLNHAIEFALHYDAEAWIDKTMVEIVRGKVEPVENVIATGTVPAI